MGNFGERMQREREMRGITLEEIAEATKIGTRSLRALEAQEFTKLPGGIFNKGFVRAYAKYLGIDEEQAVADYSEALAEAQAAGLLGKVEAQDPNSELHALAAVTEKPESPPSASFAAIAIAILILVAIGVGGWTYYSRYRATKVKAAAPHPASLPAQVQPSPTPAQVPQGLNATPSTASAEASKPAAEPTSAKQSVSQPSGTQTAASSPEASTSEFEFRVRARENSWISLVVDGRQVMEGNLNASSEKSFRAHQQVVMKTGNAGALEVSLNGKPQPSLGDSNQVRTLTFTAEGIRQ